MSIKIGIIGAGGMTNYHIPGFKEAGADVAAIADVNTAAAQRVADKFGIPKVYGNIAAMIKSEKLDAVSVITPNKFHKPLAIQALKAGLSVFCEKPPALNAAEMTAMAAAAKKAKKTLMFDFNNRARPESFAMKAYLDNGAVGRINSAQALWIRRTGIPGFGGWFTTKALSGGGPVIDLLHMIDLALHFMDYPQPEWVLAQTFSDFISDKGFKGPWGIPDVAHGVTDVEASAHGFVRFKGGQVLFLRNAWAEMNKREEVSVTFQGQKAGGCVKRLFGRDGLDETSIDSCELYTQENGCSVNRDIVTAADPAMGRVRAAKNFVLALEGKEKPLNTPDEAVKLMKIIDALYASAKSGKPVKVK
ncbi:MAG TPA: Gfo/Idh/MocA family oxidoreductase [Kiritimatiellia bacterium]|nr:Gfo/Idh/MocA family oxidoreductase [Kiritimatiellia bacterium]HPS07338.1 Gfo/Idh/MocA family oxidoreductase [Kiritimatiellia bacterium]